MGFTRSKGNGDTNGPFYWSRQWNVQPKPYVRPLEFWSENCRTSPGGDYTEPARFGVSPRFDDLPTWRSNLLTSKATEKFRSSISEGSLWAVNYAERKSALNSAVKRLESAAFSLWALWRKRWQAISRAARRNARNWNQTFLEFHFGWIPLIEDVHSAAKTVLGPVPYGRFQGTHKDTWRTAYYGPSSSRHTSVFEASVRVQGEVGVSNPNLYLLNQLGLLNPAAIAWELVPYSFVLDWFTNIGQVLGQFTAFGGLDTSRVSWTFQSRAESKRWITYGPEGFSVQYDGPSHRAFHMHRRPGIPAVLPTVYPFRGMSVVRGTTAIALLLQRGAPFSTLFKRS